MLEALSYQFIQNALIAGILVSLISGIMGSLIVVNRMVFLAGGIAHAAYGGIGIAIFTGIPIFFGTSVFAVVAAVLMAFVTIKNRENMDTFIGLIWAVGMAIGIILVDLTPGYNVDLMSYLFGSILAVSTNDLYFMGALFLIILFVISFWYRNILAVSYDSEYAALSGINVKFFYTLIFGFISPECCDCHKSCWTYFSDCTAYYSSLYSTSPFIFSLLNDDYFWHCCYAIYDYRPLLIIYF